MCHFPASMLAKLTTYMEHTLSLSKATCGWVRVAPTHAECIQECWCYSFAHRNSPAETVYHGPWMQIPKCRCKAQSGKIPESDSARLAPVGTPSVPSTPCTYTIQTRSSLTTDLFPLNKSHFIPEITPGPSVVPGPVSISSRTTFYAFQGPYYIVILHWTWLKWQKALIKQNILPLHSIQAYL